MNVATFFNRKMNSNPVTRYNDPGALFSPGIALYLARMPLQTANGALRATGKSCAYSVLMLAAWGDSSIEAAKRQAGVQQVAVITVENLAVLAGFLYHRHCTIVSGT
ncbi:MAG: hypothetical protein HS115_10925 [Spirochaetales bacterium]|nr:hypothetical protein [Spirochaetales bacterium]